MSTVSKTSFGPRHRPLLTLAGAVAGLAFWLLVEVLPDWLTDRRLLGAACLFAGLFGALLLMTGPVRLARALLPAAGLGIVAGLLAYVGAGRFEQVDAFLRTGHPLAVLFLIIILSVPFMTAALLPGRPWRTYRVLFDLAWSAVIRVVTALCFLGVVWLFLWLSDLVLDLVGLSFLEDFVEWGAAPFMLSGAVVGLGLAVAGEFGAVLSPALPLGLLRLIVLPAATVMGLFIVVLPFRGLSNAFGTLSATSVLIAMTITGACLVSAVADRSDADSSDAKALQWGARVMSILMACFAALALYGVAVRVGQYGWSPDRVLAGLAGLVASGYGFGYLGALAARARWMAAIRGVNIFVALATLALAALSLTPLINPQRIATEAQIARYETGRTPAERLDLWAIARDWGVAGTSGLDRLREFAEADADLALRLEAYDAADSRFAFENGLSDDARADLVADLLDILPVRPEGAVVPESVFADSGLRQLEMWRDACASQTPAGNPGCAIFVGAFEGDAEPPHFVLFTLNERDWVTVQVLRDGTAPGSFGPTWVTRDYTRTHTPDLIDSLVDGSAQMVPLPLQALRFEGADLLVLP